jgi:hypothetical protein
MFKCGFNATEAFLLVKPHVTRESAAVGANRLLSSAKTQAVLAEMAKAAVDRNELDQDYIIGCWVALTRSDVFTYFEQDEKGNLTLKKKLPELSFAHRRNIKKIKMRTEQVNEMVTAQHVELEMHDWKGAVDSMAKAAGLFGKIGEEATGGIADAIERGFERVRKQQGGRTFDAAGIDITEAVG